MLQTRDTGVTHDPSSSSLTPLPTSNQSIGIYTSPKMSHIYLLLSISSATPVPHPTCLLFLNSFPILSSAPPS